VVTDVFHAQGVEVGGQGLGFGLHGPQALMAVGSALGLGLAVRYDSGDDPGNAGQEGTDGGQIQGDLATASQHDDEHDDDEEDDDDDQQVH
jgi:hypothetical protein